MGCAGSTNRTNQLNETKKFVLALFFEKEEGFAEAPNTGN
jgi:hypothetical protein